MNQTVDSMVEERAVLQKKVQQLQLEVDSHGRARRQLEHENAHLLERVSGFEQQQVGFLKDILPDIVTKTFYLDLETVFRLYSFYI